MTLRNSSGTILLSFCIFLAIFSLFVQMVFYKTINTNINFTTFLKTTRSKQMLLDNSLTKIFSTSHPESYYIIEEHTQMFKETIRRQFLFWHPNEANNALKSAAVQLASLTIDESPIISFVDSIDIYSCANNMNTLPTTNSSQTGLISQKYCTIQELLEQIALNGNFVYEQNLKLENKTENEINSKSISGNFKVNGTLEIDSPTLLISGGDIDIQAIKATENSTPLTLVSLTGSITINQMDNKIIPKFIYLNDLSAPSLSDKDNKLYPKIVVRSLIGLYDPLL